MTFDEARAYGKYGEDIARDWFRSQGWYVLPAADIKNGGAPTLYGQQDDYILPDLQIINSGCVRWVEVKWKDSPDLYQKTRRFRHGVDLKNWNQYLRLEEQTGIPGDLAIVQLRPGREAQPDPILLCATFAKLASHFGGVGSTDVGWGANCRAVAFWDVELFTQFPLDCPEPPFPPLARRDPHPWEQKSQAGTAPQMNQPPLWDVA